MFRFVKDQKVEANLKAMGIAFEVANVPKEKIDFPEGLRRQARLINGLNQDYVIQLSLKMAEKEAAFPFIILHKPPHGKFWPVSGNHRAAAWELAFPDETNIDAYIITIKDPVMMDVFPRVVNVWESGIGFSREEKVMNARWCIEHHSMPVAEAATLFGVKQNWIYRANAAAEAKRIVADIRGASGLSNSLLGMLHTLGDPDVIRAVAQTLISYDAGHVEKLAVLADVKAKETSAERLKEVKRWNKIFTERQEQPPEKVTPTSTTVNGKATEQTQKKTPERVLFRRQVRADFLRLVTGLAKMLEDHSTLEKLQITDPADMMIAEKAWKTIREKFNGLYGKAGAR